MLVLDRVSSVDPLVRVRELPAVECCFAAWAARAPEREPLVKAAQRIQSRMPGGMQDYARDLDRTLAGWPLRAVNAFYRVGGDDFDEALGALRDDDPSRVAVDLLLGSVSRPDRVPAAATDGGDPLAAAIESSFVPPSVSRSMRSLLSRPDETVGAVLDVIRAFWRAGFSELWAAQEEARAQQSSRFERQLRGLVGARLAELAPRGLFDAGQDRLLFLGGQATKIVPCDELDVFDVIPSLWLRRRVVLAYAPRRLGVSLAADVFRAEALPTHRVPELLALLGDPRRFEIVRLCTAEARSTSELARLLGITEGPVSRHLRGLEKCGLLVGQRFGRQVTYAAVPEVMALLGRQLQRLPLDGQMSQALAGSASPMAAG